MKFLFAVLALCVAQALAFSPSLMNVKNSLASFQPAAPTADTDACTTAVTYLVQNYTSCEVLMRYDAAAFPSQIVNMTYHGEVCASSCVGDFANAAINAKELCAPAFLNGTLVAEVAANLRTLVDIAQFQKKAYCAKIADKFCFPQFLAVVSNVSEIVADPEVSAVTLPGYCNDCVIRLAPFLESYMAADKRSYAAPLIALRAVRNTLCSKEGNNYCLPVFRAFRSQNESTYTGSVFCSPCVARALSIAAANGISDASKGLDKIKALCDRTSSGDTCVDKATAVVPKKNEALAACGSVIAGPCTDACKAFIRQTITGTGCCFSTILNSDAQLALAAPNLKSKCDIPFPDTCDTIRKPSNLTLTIPNIKKAYFDANKGTILYNLRQDLADLAGVLLDQISFPGVTLTPPPANPEISARSAFKLFADSSVTVLAKIDAPNADSVTASLATNLKAGAEIPTLLGLPADAKNEPFAESLVSDATATSSTSSSSSSTGTNGGSTVSDNAASAVPVSIAFSAVLAIASLFLM